jgi:hypothetical protein
MPLDDDSRVDRTPTAAEVFRPRLRPLLEACEGALLLALAVASWPLSRFLLTDLGARRDERDREWPGDRLLARIDTQTTRGISILAPAATVWPWLVQIGLGRGGFYSYELLERLGGIDVTNLERIESRFQSLGLGDEILLHPAAPGLTVALLETDDHLCFRTWKDRADLEARDPALVASWSFYLVARSAASCRLLVRACKQVRRPRRLGAHLAAALLEDPLDLVMEQRMLRTIRRLAEHRSP